MARSLFLYWLRSSWHSTTVPVGRWVMRMADSVLLTCCPPAPEERKVSICRSLGSMVNSTSSASGITATVAAEVWMRPEDSVSGTRWTRWVPASNFRRDQAPWPSMVALASLTPPSSVVFSYTSSMFQPRRSAYRAYIRSRSAANRAPSSPPIPARTSRMTFRSSLGSRGSSRRLSSSDRRSRSWRARCSSSWASSRISGSDSSSCAPAQSASACCQARKAATMGVSSFCSRLRRVRDSRSAYTAGSDSCRSTWSSRRAMACNFSSIRTPYWASR